MEVLLLVPVSTEHGYGLGLCVLCGLSGLSGWGTWKGGLLGVSLRERLEVVELDSLSSEDSMKSLSSVADKRFFFRYHWDFFSLFLSSRSSASFSHRCCFSSAISSDS